jgi:hypothetical protein
LEKDEGRRSGVVVRLAANGFHSGDCLEVLRLSMSFFLLLFSQHGFILLEKFSLDFQFISCSD